MSQLDDDVRAADAMGLSYGRWRALTDALKEKAEATKKPHPSPKRERKRRFTDEQAFKLWKAGKTDAEIAAAVGVSRARIQRWRDILELPSTSKHYVDTSVYRLEQMADGMYVVLIDDLDEF